MIVNVAILLLLPDDPPFRAIIVVVCLFKCWCRGTIADAFRNAALSSLGV